MRRLLLCLLLPGLVLAACGDDSEDDGGGEGGETVTFADLEGRTFAGDTVTGHEVVAGSTITLAFTDGRISAQAGCNTQNGGADVVDGAIVLTGELASTMMGCEQELMDQDQWLAGFLADEPAVALDGDTLTLTAGEVTVELTAEP